MWWARCKPQAPGEEKEQPGWPWGLVTMKSPTPDIGLKKAGEQLQVVKSAQALVTLHSYLSLRL